MEAFTELQRPGMTRVGIAWSQQPTTNGRRLFAQGIAKHPSVRAATFSLWSWFKQAVSSLVIYKKRVTNGCVHLYMQIEIQKMCTCTKKLYLTWALLSLLIPQPSRQLQPSNTKQISLVIAQCKPASLVISRERDLMGLST